jgi:hypothetical protein
VSAVRPSTSAAVAASTSAASPRLALARLARGAALDIRGVVDTDAGAAGTRATFGGGERVSGVVCTATHGGVYELELHLVTEPVPLHALADRVRKRVHTLATRARLDALVGPIDVVFEDVRAPADGELA